MLIKFYNFFAIKIRELGFVKKYPRIKELVKYSLAGNFSNVIDFGIYIYITRTFIFWWRHYLIANLISMLVASLVRFFLQKYWTFKNFDSSLASLKKQYLKFILLLTGTILLEEWILYMTVEFVDVNDLVGKIIAFAFGTIIVYTLSKHWVFKQYLDN